MGEWGAAKRIGLRSSTQVMSETPEPSKTNGVIARRLAIEALERIEVDGAYANLLAPKLLEESDLDERDRCLLYTSPSPRDQRGSRMPSSA